MFTTTAAYDSAVTQWLSRGLGFPETLVPVLDHALDLSYGENPHQQAVYYAERRARTHLLARVEQLHGQAALVQQSQRPLGRPVALRSSSTGPRA